MVLFRIEALRPHVRQPAVADDTIKRMFDIPPETDLQGFSHAILTSAGVRLAPITGSGLYNPVTGSLSPHPPQQETYSQRFADTLVLFEPDQVDCLGAGELTDFFPAVVMWVRLEGRLGNAKAYFAQEPYRGQYDLLRAVGVQFVSGHWQGGRYEAQFTLDLGQHFHAGELSGFSKTGYCNAFFLQQGSIGQKLHDGLKEAASQRIAFARQAGFDWLRQMGRQALLEPQPMWCQPPAPRQAFPFGDLVPLGFLLAALRLDADAQALPLVEQLSALLASQRSDRRGESALPLWPFQHGDIPTSTDSALVLLGMNDLEAVAALEIFQDGAGGYLPQLSDAEGAPGKMQTGEWNRHWVQADFPTTCLIRAYRQRAGLPETTPLEYLAQNFHCRSGLFFANPYLVDYAVALNFDTRFNQASAQSDLPYRLAREIIASMNSDYSFGLFDQPLSSALAVLSLSVLGQASIAAGWNEQRHLIAQLRLSEMLTEDWPEMAPFYSTFKMPIFGDYVISLYLDRSKVITHSLILMALCSSLIGDASQVNNREVASKATEAHPRYSCNSPETYVRQVALPVYAGQVVI